MRLMEGEHVGPFNLGNPGEFTMLELAHVSLLLFLWIAIPFLCSFLFHAISFRIELIFIALYDSSCLDFFTFREDKVALPNRALL